MLINLQLMSLQVFWPQRKSDYQLKATKPNSLTEVQLLFTSVPTTIGWYSLAYNASATGKASMPELRRQTG